jgi:hypothetical protein
VDLTRPVTYRTFSLNTTTTVPGVGTGTGISGCTIDSARIGAADVVQFLEKRALHDGMDAGDVFLGARQIALTGTLYGLSRTTFFDAVDELRDALDPVLAFAEDEALFGFLPLAWAETRTGGVVTITAYARPAGLEIVYNRDSSGGDDSDRMAARWSTSFVMRDPKLYES